MECIFCKKQAGFFKRYHENCKNSAENTMQQIESLVNSHRNDDIVSKEVKMQIRNLAISNDLYKNYLNARAINNKDIQKGEVIIHIESKLKITETKRVCRMVETGYRYQKKPMWKEEEFLLDTSGKVIFTDKAIYLSVGIGTMRYPYKKIVNYGYNKMWISRGAFFDIKTSSPFPHRFLITDNFKRTEARKEQNITLFLHSLV